MEKKWSIIAIRQNNRNKTTHDSYNNIIVLLIGFYFVPGINLLQLGMVSTYHPSFTR